MDDELKAIQDDLDSVLDRLGDYMAGDKLHTEFVQWDGATREDAAVVAHAYATCSTPQDLAGAIMRFRLARAQSAGDMDKYIDAYGEGVGGMVAAIAALVESSAIPDEWLLAKLRSASHGFMEGEANWFGQAEGLPLTRSKRKGERPAPPLVRDGYLNKNRSAKLMATLEVFLRSREGGMPIDDGLFELVGESENIKPGTLKAAYYSEEARRFREAHKLVEDITGQKLG